MHRVAIGPMVHMNMATTINVYGCCSAVFISPSMREPLREQDCKPLLLMPALCAVLLLSACAGLIPQADPIETWIGLKGEAPNDLMAERVDGKRVDDGCFFEVTPGIIAWM